MSINMEGKFEAALARIDAAIWKLRQPYSPTPPCPPSPLPFRSTTTEPSALSSSVRTQTRTTSAPLFSCRHHQQLHPTPRRAADLLLPPPAHSQIPIEEVTNPHLTSTSLKETPVKRKFPKFPFFKEGDPRKWIGEIEEYFDFYEIPGVYKISESQKLNCATLHLRGRASQGFHRHIKPRIHEMSWSMFLEKLIDQFDSTELEESNKSIVVDEVNVMDVVSCEKNRNGVVFDSLENLEMENYRSDKSSKVFDELENQGKEKLIDQFGILEIEIDDADLGRKIQEDVVVEDCDVVEGENKKDDKAAVALDKKNLTWETNLMDDYEEKFRTFSIVIEEIEEKLMFAKKISKMSSSSVCGNASNTIFPNLELRLSFRRNVKRAEFEVHTVVIGSDMVMLNGWPPPICKIDDEEDCEGNYERSFEEHQVVGCERQGPGLSLGLGENGVFMDGVDDYKGFCVAMMIDTEGSQMCLIDHGSDSSVKAEDGSMWLFTTEKFEGSRPFTVQLNYEEFSEGVMVGDELVIDGGMATFEVVERFGTDLRCKCTDPGLLLPRAKLSFWRDGELVGKSSGLPTLTTKDWADIEFGISEGVDFIAVSFVKDANDIKHLKNYLSRRSSEFVKVLAKIESIESLENLGDIIEASDRDHVVWSSILSACLSNSYSEQGKGLLVRYVSDGYTLDPFMFATAFSLQLHSCLSKSAFLRDLFVRSSLMDMYVSFGMVDEVYRSFLECEEKNEMIFGSMIHGFVSSASYSSAIALVPDMRKTGMSMDPLILSFMIKAVTSLDMWEEGRALHGQIVKQDGESIRRGTLFQIVQVIKTEGWGGLYSGLKPSLIGTTASQGIYYFFYQVFKNKAEAIALSRKKKGIVIGK